MRLRGLLDGVKEWEVERDVDGVQDVAMSVGRPSGPNPKHLVGVRAAFYLFGGRPIEADGDFDDHGPPDARGLHEHLHYGGYVVLAAGMPLRLKTDSAHRAIEIAVSLR